MTGPRAPMKGVRDLWLPSEEARLWDPKRFCAVETPLDERGLVDLDALVALGKQTVESSYDWRSPFNDVHHLQWPRSGYQDDTVASEFRELVSRKSFMPRRFHNWLHLVTLPPPVPDEEVMRYSIAAEKTARALAITAQRAVRMTRKQRGSDANLAEKLNRAFDEYTLYIENAREVPPEFQLLKLEEVEAHDIEGMLAANKRLGRLALDRLPIRNRQIAA